MIDISLGTKAVSSVRFHHRSGAELEREEGSLEAAGPGQGGAESTGTRQ